MFWIALASFILFAVCIAYATSEFHADWTSLVAGLFAAIFMAVTVITFAVGLSNAADQSKKDRLAHDKHLCSLIPGTQWIDEAGICLSDGKTVIHF